MKIISKILMMCSLPLFAQSAIAVGNDGDTLITYRAELGVTAGNGDFAPLWHTANRNGLSSIENNSGYLRAGVGYKQELANTWKVGAGLDIAAARNFTNKFIVQQAYADISWQCINLSIGSKERAPLGKNPLLSSGGMVEGNNARPVPQVRVEIGDYWTVPGTKEWFALKGHIAYGRFVDDNWQRDFVTPGNSFLQDVLYHSKLLMFKIGNRKRFPLEAEIGMLMSAQFGGDLYRMDNDGNIVLDTDMPDGFKDYLKVLIPSAGGSDTPRGDQVNVYGNHVGSWNVAFNYYYKDWKFRMYYEHLFEDHSQMFWEYGRWKDGHLGLEVTFPKNRWVETLLWEGLATKDQTGPILYDGYAGAFPEYQVSARDDYYNNYYYQSWQHAGIGMGNPLLPGPAYNRNGDLTFRSNRVKANHVGLTGCPVDGLRYRVLMSYAKHWGTYSNPLDEIATQFSSLFEVGYTFSRLQGLTFLASLGWDKGDYLGDNVGGMITIRKEGVIWKK